MQLSIRNRLISLFISALFICTVAIKTADASPKIIIQFPWHPTIEFVSFYYAKYKHFFKAENLDVTFKHWYPGVDIPQSIENGSAQIGIQDAIQLLMGIDKGYQLKAVYAPLQETPLCLISLKKNNIESVKDLYGKTLGTHKGYEYLLDFIIAAHPFLKNHTKIKTVDYDLISPLENNEIDAGTFFETAQAPIFRIKGSGINIIRYNEIGFDLYSHVLFTKTEYYEKNQIILKKILQIISKTNSMVAKNPNKMVEFFCDKIVPYNEFIEYKFPNETIYKKYQLASLQTNIYYMRKGVNDNYGIMNGLRWDAMINHLKRMKLINGGFSYHDVYTNKLLKEIYETR